MHDQERTGLVARLSLIKSLGERSWGEVRKDLLEGEFLAAAVELCPGNQTIAFPPRDLIEEFAS